MKHNELKLPKPRILLAIAEAAGRFRLDPTWMIAMAAWESDYRPHAHNKPEDARGLFQIRSCALLDANLELETEIHQDDLFQVEPNCLAAAAFISRIDLMLKRVGQEPTWPKRLGCYNAGFGNMRKAKFDLFHQTNNKKLASCLANVRRYYRNVKLNRERVVELVV